MSSNLFTKSRLTRAESAQFLTERGYPIAKSTLASKVSRGDGPPFETFNRRAIYEVAKLLKWAIEQKWSRGTAPATKCVDDQISKEPSNG